MTSLRQPFALLVVATIVAGTLLLVAPEHAGLVAHAWLVVSLALAFAFGLVRLRRAVPGAPSRFDAVFAPKRSGPARPASLARVEREVTLSTGTAFDVHFRLRPLVRQIAAGLLIERGVDLERRPARAQELLATETWELVRPDRSPPTDRSAPGLPIDAIGRVVDDLERVSCS